MDCYVLSVNYMHHKAQLAGHNAYRNTPVHRLHVSPKHIKNVSMISKVFGIGYKL